MEIDSFISEWKKGHFKPVYWLEGEESFFIDQLLLYAEKNILSEEQKGFNLSVFYGKDADWASVVNTCRKYPMNAPMQVVLLKEAQHMRDIDKLEGYVEKPARSTMLLVGYKEKKLDGRKGFAKKIKSSGGEIWTTRKMFDSQLPTWVGQHGKSLGVGFEGRSAELLVEHIGNDLSRLHNEIAKIIPNLKGRKSISEDDIETYVGISKEYNLFELQHALTQRNLMRCLQIIQYFDANPKAAPVQQLMPALYSFFSKAYLVFGLATNNEFEMAKQLGYERMNPYVKDIINCAKNYRQKGVEHAILIMHEYNLKSLGIHSVTLDEGALLKEMIVKMIHSTSVEN